MIQTLPTETLTLNVGQRNLIKSGVDLLAARQAGVLKGFLPYCHPWHRVNLHASDIYRGKAHDTRMAGVFLSLQMKLSPAAKGKINLNALEISAAAFIARVTRERRLEQQTGRPETPAEDHPLVRLTALENKLEVARRRARHAAIKQVGKASYDGLAQAWDRFLQWMRYFLLYGPQYMSNFRLLRQTGITMRTHKYKRDEMIALAERVIARRSYVRIPAHRICKIVDLAIAELRRERHPGLTVMTVIRDREVGPEFMFEFLNARVDLEPLKRVNEWYDRPQSLADKFEALMNPVALTTPVRSGRSVERSDTAEASRVKPPQSPAALSAPASTKSAPTATAKPLSNAELADAVAKWLKDWIPQPIWERVIDEARFQVIRWPARFHPLFTSAASLDELIDLCRPKQNPPDPWEDPGAALEEINNSVDWLLGWMSALKGDAVAWAGFAWQAYGILGEGLGRAKKLLGAEASVRYNL
jgi:hypothetical protein